MRSIPTGGLASPLLQDIGGPLVACGDALTLFVCGSVVVALAEGESLYSADLTFAVLGAGVLLSTLASFQLAGLYRFSALIRVAFQSTRLLAVWCGVAAISGGAAFWLMPDHRVTVLAFVCAVPAALILVRCCFALGFRAALKSGRLRRRVLIVGLPEEAQAAIDAISRDSLVRAIGFVPIGAETGDDELEEALNEYASSGLSEVVLLSPGQKEASERVTAWALGRPIRLLEMPRHRLQGAIESPVLTISELGLLVVDRPLSTSGLVAKAAVDRVGAVALLLAFGLPMLLIALAVKLDSPGPALFWQRRHGYDRRVFRICKFRSMTVLEDGNSIRQATKEDARVTRVGRFIRAHSLDELPQIFNVLWGEMSLVGPRPHALAHDDYYGRLIPKYDHRFRVKPGISGWAQVNGLRGETETLVQMSDRVDHDNFYIDNWSLARDIAILLRTLLLGFGGRNTY